MKLNYRHFFVGFAFLSIIAFWELYDGVIPKCLKGHSAWKQLWGHHGY